MDNSNKSTVISNKNAEEPISELTNEQDSGLGKEVSGSYTNHGFVPEHASTAQKNEFVCELPTDTTQKLAKELAKCNSIKLEENEKQPNDNEETDRVAIKDAGYAWVVVAAMFVTNVLTTGYIKGFGVIYNEILVQYPEATGTMAGVMMSLLSGFRSLCAPFVGPLASFVGVRKTMYLGAFLYSFALLISYFCDSLILLSITLGAMIGMGHCILESSQIIIITQYFEKKLSKANGIRVAGSPFGGILYPLLLTLLIQNFGLKITYLVLSAIALNVFICAFLMKPFQFNGRTKVLDKVKKLLSRKTSNVEAGTTFQIKGQGNQLDVAHQNEIKGISYQTSNNMLVSHTLSSEKQGTDNLNQISSKTKNSSIGKPKRKLDFSFLKNPQYILYIIMAACIPVGVPLALYYTTLFAKNEANLTHYEVTILLSYQAVLDCFLRIFIGWVNNKNLYKKSNGFAVCLWLSALGCISITFGNKSLLHLIGSITLYSFGPAAYHTFVNVILTERFGKENIASTWGFVRMTHGIFCFVHPPVIGYVVDSTGSYAIPFLIMGSGLILSGLIVISERCFGGLSENSKEEKKIESA